MAISIQPSIHFFHLSGARSRKQQSKQRSSDFHIQTHYLQLIWRDPKAALTCNTLIMNKNEMSEENIDKMIKMGSDVEAVLREEVLQVEQVEENKLLLRDGLLLENVPYCDEPRKKS
uniref:Uncharacterized protein n=1 Tax=Cyprinodon variegatus TaxID=28743 RepID=A0A3Q2DLY0_CYPVA